MFLGPILLISTSASIEETDMHVYDENNDIPDALEGSLLTSMIGRDKLKIIANASSRRVFSAREIIVHEGDIATDFFVILGGQVEVKRGGKTIAKLGRGQFFGETTLVPNESRAADVVAMEPTECLQLNGARFKELVEANPQIALRLIEELVRRYGKTTAMENNPSTIYLQNEETSDLSFEFSSEPSKRAFDSLVDSFIDDYLVRRLVAEKSGWRSLTEIANECHTPPSSLYSKQGGVGKVFDEPLRRGLIESRVFPGERGRGGEVTRLRISYEKDPVRNYVNEKVRRKREHFSALKRAVNENKSRYESD